jgi:hypothetical protein
MYKKSTYTAPYNQTITGVSWTKGDAGYIKKFPAIVLLKGDTLELTLDPDPDEGGYTVHVATWSETLEKAMYDRYDKPPRDVDQYDYLLEEK